MITATRAIAGLCVVVGVTLTSPQGGLPALAQEPDLVEISSVQLAAFPEVQFDVSVPETLSGDNVGADDVTLIENGVPIPFEVAPVPTDGLEVVLLIDTSGSMNENAALESAKLAAVAFTDELPSGVPVGVVGFSDSPSLVSPLTTDRGAIAAALGRLQAAGRTAMYDAIVFGESLFSGGTTDRQFVLVSDGGDTASVATLEDARAVTSNVRTSAIEIVTSESNPDAVASLAAAGGGRLTSIADPAALSALYQEVARSLVNRVRVSFTSQSAGETEYTVQIATVFGPLTGTTVVELPVAPPPTSTVEVAPATTVAAAEVVAPVPETSQVAATPEPTATSTSTALWPLVLGAAAVGLAVTTLLVIAATGDNRRAGRRQLGVRSEKVKTGATSSSIGERVTALADDVLERSGRRGGLAQALDVANISLRPSEYVVLTAAMAFSVGVVLLLLAGPLLGIVGVAFAVLGSASVVRVKGERRRRAFEQQLPDVLQLMTNALRSGYALPQAIDAVAMQAAEPAAAEFQRVKFETRVGLDLGESLRLMADRMQSAPFDWVVSALEINREVGGELSKVLMALATTIRERQQLDRQVQTLTAEGRMSAYVLTSLPILLMLLMAVFNRDYLESFATSPGPQILIGAGVLLVVGWVWMRTMIKAEM